MRFSERSKKELDSCHKDLIRLFERVIGKASIDFSIVQGGRTIEQARDNYKRGVSKLNPCKGQYSKHLVGREVGRDKSLAVDICPVINGKLAWSEDKVFEEIAKLVRLESEGMGIKIRWGGSWRGWDKPNTPDMLKDLGHFELVE